MHGHLLGSAVRVLSQVGHCGERVLQSLMGRDSLTPIEMQQPCHEVQKSPPVHKFSGLSFWIDLDLETDFRLGDTDSTSQRQDK